MRLGTWQPGTKQEVDARAPTVVSITCKSQSQVALRFGTRIACAQAEKYQAHEIHRSLSGALAVHRRSSGLGPLHPIPSRGVGIETNHPGAERENLAIAHHSSRAEAGKSGFWKARKAI